ncbi:MAG TPA: SHOCT domain-containing protein, partial [Polyangiales bacterium]|nr:SHOCT domain-containing protein [Polyangiales bacterium]
VFVPVPQSTQGGGFMSSSNGWWPSELGSPSSSGGQNDSRYAYFPSTRRLAIDRAGQISIYDTLDHSIGGVQQQQGGPSGSLSFSSQFGTFTVDSLPLVSGQAPQAQPAYQAPPSYQSQPYQAPAPQPSFNGGGETQGHDNILQAIERLSDLHQRGILSEDEYRAKKADLLSRL